MDDLYAHVRGVLGAGTVAVGEGAAPTITTVAPEIRVVALRTPTLPPATHTNLYLVGPEHGPVAVVDPGSPYPAEQAALVALLHGIEVSVVLLTHHHGDHVGGAVALAQARRVPIAAHAETARLLGARIPVTQVLADGERAYGAEAIFTPGHAAGHLCFAVGDAVIAGDMVAGIGSILIDPDEGDMATYLASLERLLARGEHALLPAHGPMIADGPAKLREYLAHRRMREARVVDALAGSTAQPLGELVATVYADTPRALWRLAERSLLAHLHKLAREGKARDVGGGAWAVAASGIH